MSDSVAFPLNQLPLEILHGIFYHLDVPDIVRIRRVSRYLNEVGHSRHVWSDAYFKATFVRPLGPFPSQSAGELENTLVSSFRLARNLRHSSGLTDQKETLALKLREIRCKGMERSVNLVFGRFLLVALSEEVHCYDLNFDTLDSNSGASVIYRSTGGTLRSFHCVSAVDIEGSSFACVVLNEDMQTTRQISIYLLNVGEQSEMTLDLLHQSEYNAFNIESVHLGPRVIIIQGQVGRNVIAVDVRTRTQFLFPSFIDATWETDKTRGITEIEWNTQSVSTSTHLLLARSSYIRTLGWMTFLQAIALPPPNNHHRFNSSLIPLNPSHRGIFPGIDVSMSVLLHDSILEPTTQDVLIPIRVHVFRPSRPFTSISKHGILRLSTAPRSHDQDSEVGTMKLHLLGPLGEISQVPFLHPSFNGTCRVFYSAEPLAISHGIIAALEYDLHSSGGDHDGKETARVVEYPSVLRFSSPRTLLDYDPYSGRICLAAFAGKYKVIEILDLAV